MASVFLTFDPKISGADVLFHFSIHKSGWFEWFSTCLPSHETSHDVVPNVVYSPSQEMTHMDLMQILRLFGFSNWWWCKLWTAHLSTGVAALILGEHGGKMWEKIWKTTVCFFQRCRNLRSFVALKLPYLGVSSTLRRASKSIVRTSFFSTRNVIQLRHQPPRCPLHSVVEPLCLQGVPRYLPVPGCCLSDSQGEKDGFQRGNVLQDSCGRGD